VVTSVSTLIAGNTKIVSNFNFGDPDFHGSFASASYSLLGNSEGARNFAEGYLNRMNVDPRLGPLPDNRRPTRAHALPPGSIRLQPGSNPYNLTGDQRGFRSRTVEGYADIGAYEADAVDPPPPAPSPPQPQAPAFEAVVLKQRGKFLVQVTDRNNGAVRFR